MKRLFFFIVVFISAALGIVPAFVVLGVVYAFRYTAYELIIVAAMTDVFYTTSYFSVPYLTVTSIVLVFILEWLKPRLSLYNQ